MLDTFRSAEFGLRSRALHVVEASVWQSQGLARRRSICLAIAAPV
jgi:hypothetical protein